jgi:hypothetical protein
LLRVGFLLVCASYHGDMHAARIMTKKVIEVAKAICILSNPLALVDVDKQ